MSGKLFVAVVTVRFRTSPHLENTGKCIKLDLSPR